MQYYWPLSPATALRLRSGAGEGGGEAGEGFSNGVFVMVMLRKVTTAKSNPDAE